jgi:hypothetical protein
MVQSEHDEPLEINNILAQQIMKYVNELIIVPTSIEQIWQLTIKFHLDSSHEKSPDWLPRIVSSLDRFKKKSI